MIDDNTSIQKHNGWHCCDCQPRGPRSRAFYYSTNSLLYTWITYYTEPSMKVPITLHRLENPYNAPPPIAITGNSLTHFWPRWLSEWPMILFTCPFSLHPLPPFNPSCRFLLKFSCWVDNLKLRWFDYQEFWPAFFIASLFSPFDGCLPVSVNCFSLDGYDKQLSPVVGKGEEATCITRSPRPFKYKQLLRQNFSAFLRLLSSWCSRPSIP